MRNVQLVTFSSSSFGKRFSSSLWFWCQHDGTVADEEDEKFF